MLASCLQQAARQLDPQGILAEPTEAYALPGAELPWREWLQRSFPYVATAPLADRHVRLWEWFDALAPGQYPRPHVEIWPRGGAKSSTAELGTVRVGVKLSRRFGLYVSGTQEQADKHVRSIASLFESAGIGRAVNKYGHSKGWRRNQLRTMNGFNVAALGLDVAVRGVKLDEYRPDFFIFDDIDSQEDSPQTIRRKKEAITTAIIPTSSFDAAFLFVQNLVHEESIFAELADGRADFLHDREVPPIEPAVRDLETEIVEREDGAKVYAIVHGTPTWEGQDRETCERQINAWGLRAFKREAQHEVAGADGYFFDTSKLRAVQAADVPPLRAVCLAGDLAATEGGGNHTALFLTGVDVTDRYYILAVIRGQWGSDRVRACIRLAVEHYRGRYAGLRLRLPQDGGQAGKAQSDELRKEFAGAAILPVTGKKWTRATNFSEQVNLGNYALVCENLPDWPVAARTEETGYRPLLEDLSYERWHRELKDELRRFRENVADQLDDQVDAGSDAHNDISRPKRVIRAH